MKNQLIMKKFLTFFAMMFALLGFSSQPINAADPEYTVYVDVSNKTGWDNVYIRTQWSSKDWGWPVQNKTERIAGTNIFKVVFEYGDFNNLTSIVFANRKADDYTPENECYDNGTGASGWFNKSENKLTMGALYTLNANNQQATITPNYTPATPPYIFINGSSTAFTGEGSNWVYTVDASTVDKGFRIQNAVDNTPLGSSVAAKVFLGTNDGFEVSATGTKTLQLWGSTDQYYTAKSGATYKLSIPKTADLANYDKPFVLTITRTEAGPYIPAAPELPKTATSNKVTIPAVDKAEVYYIISATDPGEPNTTTWMKYTGAIELNAANVTIWAAAKATDSNGEWSSVVSQSYSYGMPVPTVSISNDGTVTISVPSLVDGANLMYGFSESTINQTYDSSNKPKATAGQTVYAKYVHTVLGSSDVAYATYSGPRTIKEIILYTRKNIQDGNDANSGKATAPDADGIWKLGTVSIPSGAGSGHWDSTMSVKVVYSDGTETWYSTTQNTEINTIQANGWKNTYARNPWPVNSDKNCGFFVEGSGGKNVTIYAKFIGDNMQIAAVMPNNTLTIGSTAPQVTGWAVGVTTVGGQSWSSWTDFTKKSDNPKQYVYEFDATGNAYFMLKINGKMYQPANGKLELSDGSTYVFVEKTEAKEDNQCTLSGLTSGTRYAMTLTETELGLRLSITEAGIPTPVFVREAESNTVTVKVPDGCTLHYTIGGGAERTTTSNLTLTVPKDGMTISAYFTKEGTEGQGETVTQSFVYYDVPQRWASVEWSLSDNEIMPTNSVKYFYLSRYQNDDRVSPEWELIKDGNDYTLDYFMCIPAAEFRLRRVAKDINGNISYRDFGLDAVSKVQPATIGATAATVGTADAPKQVSKNFTINNGNKSRGYAWDLGYTMVSVKVTDSTDGNNSTGPNTLTMTLSADFSKPSTANVAPIKGMPYIALTGSKLQIPAIKGQNIKHAVDLPDGYSNAFTNAWIQYDKDTQMYVYGSGVTDNNLYTGGGSYYKPQDGAVMNSTILPPRYPIMFKLIDDQGGETMVSSNKTILRYKGQQQRQFTTPDGKKTTKRTNFAVYALNDMEMSGLFKIYSGYGGFKYGSVDNGLSLHSNWGVGHQGSTEPYASSVIPSKVAMPLNGGGPKTNADGSAYRDPSHTTTQEPYDGYEDNYAGRYFEFSERTYVSELDFYYALEPDTEPINNSNSLVAGGGVDTNYNSHHADDATWNISNPTNDGRNFSWFRFTYSGSIGQIKLDKTGVDSGLVTWSINKDNTGQDIIREYKVVFYQVDPTKQPGEDGYIIGNEITVEEEKDLPSSTTVIPEASNPRPDLVPGWYEAKLYYWVDTEIEDENGNLTSVTNYPKEATSTRILIFKMAAADITAQQRVTTASDGVKVYHPVIDVTPDASASLQALHEGTSLSTVYAEIEVEGISTTAVTRITDMEGNDFPIYTETAPTTGIAVKYDRDNRRAIVHYPMGFFTSKTDIPDMRFAVRNAAIDKRTNFTMTISSSEGTGASSDTYAMVYMPAGQLYGKLVADRKKTDDGVAYNALAVSNEAELPEGESADGYARIRYVDRNNGDNICYIGTMGGTEVKAEIKYVTLNEDGTHETEKVLFDGEKLDMRLNPENQDAVYTSKRLKIAGIPYQTETVKDAAGEEISVRKDQEATFSVQLTYSISGMDDFISREKDTTLEYKEDELTSPRQGLADLKTADDVRGGSASNGKTYATDVTAVTESYVENYGGLFTNIEDAHVALQAVDRNENLVGFNSFNKWYMNHGDKWDEAPANDISNPLNVNPFNPADHRAVGNTKRNGVATYESVEEVHPLLRGNSKVTSSSSFQNTTALNNAWWNTRAYTKPEFHEYDHIKGDFTRDANTGAITGWTAASSISKPRQHREWWAGVKAGNDDKYQVFDGSTVIKDEAKGIDTDIRDPKHSYYGMDSHFTTEDGIRTAYYLGEMPLNANDILAFYGDPTNPNPVVEGYLNGYSSLKNVAMEIHNAMEIPVTEANYGNDGKSSVSIDGTTYTLDIPVSTPWNLDNIWKARAELAFKADNTTLSGKSPAEAIFEAANKHMIFKVNHVNHESWWAPGAYHQIVQLDIKTRPIWGAFKGVKNGEGKTIDDYTSDADKEKFVMGIIRMNLDDYCPLAYDVRYTYPFLTTEKVTAENYNNAVTARSATDDFSRIANMYATVTESDITDVAARDTGRVPFFDKTTMSPDEIVPTAIADVNADIRGNGFSIIYNRAAGTVTISAEGDRELKEAAVYDATGASLVRGASADCVNDQTIVLDVRGIVQGAYVISTNLGGAKFMK